MKKMTMKFVRVLGCTALSVFMLGGSAHAGAWTAKRGSMYNKLTYNYYSTDQNFDSAGDKVDFPNGGSFTNGNLNYYLEYGITDSLTFSSSVYYQRLKYEQDDASDMKTSGVADIDLALKYNLYSSHRHIVSVQGLVKIPETYDKHDSPPLGSGQYDYEVRLMYGASLWPEIPGYCNFEIGYRFRAEEPADELKYLLEFGTKIYGDSYWRVKLDGAIGMGNADSTVDELGNQSTAYDASYGKVDLALGYKFTERWSVEAGYVKEAFGESANAGQTYSLAVILSI